MAGYRLEEDSLMQGGSIVKKQKRHFLFWLYFCPMETIFSVLEVNYRSAGSGRSAASMNTNLLLTEDLKKEAISTIY